jgi:uncharacterized heparinase superfamily protein
MSDEKSSVDVSPSRSNSLVPRIRRALRGEVDAGTIAREAVRRTRAAYRQRRERAALDQLNTRPARLLPQYAGLTKAGLLTHFRERTTPRFFRGFYRSFDPSVQGFSIKTRSGQWTNYNIVEWRRDPLSGVMWPLEYHADLVLQRQDGSDARMLWESNRLGRTVELAASYTATRDENYADEFFALLDTWRAQNPVGRGPNWACAMEVALRAINTVGALAAFRHSPKMDERRLLELLAFYEQHGKYIWKNLEFSYIATSNHYLSDVVGLLWLGLGLPELRAAAAWRRFGLREMLREMDKQVLPDGADFESSTGYHRMVTELFLYSFLLCRENGVEIEQKYWDKLRAMVAYLCAYMRPDGRAPLIGDSDGGQVFPFKGHDGDDHAYLAAIGAVVFDEPAFKLSDGQKAPKELIWYCGRQGVEKFESMKAAPAASQAFPDAGAYILRHEDLYLYFNTSGAGINGRGSHSHNDKLAIEVSAGGTAFLVDPGTYLYSADWAERSRFRSTAYHSTVMIDGEEQNITDEKTPFVIGDEAHPRVIEYEFTEERDVVTAEHDGYRRLAEPVTHRRTVEFHKGARFWLVTDSFTGEGDHEFTFVFHFAPGLEITVSEDHSVTARDGKTDASLLIKPLGLNSAPDVEPRFSSRNYGKKDPSTAAVWTANSSALLSARWAIIPLRAGEDPATHLSTIGDLPRPGANP